MKRNNIISVFTLSATLLLASCNTSLPKPTPQNGYLGETFGVDKNINMETIDKYLSRKDVVYRDMRMLEDPGFFEALEGGDSKLSGFINGFEVVPLPFIVPISLPPSVGLGYQGETLFDADYQPYYHEAELIVESLFPKNKIIFLMCGGGGYAKSMKDVLVNLGWDANKIYNVGGYWSYTGNNNIMVKRIENEVTYFDFWKVPYHNIDFTTLNRI